MSEVVEPRPRAASEPVATGHAADLAGRNGGTVQGAGPRERLRCAAFGVLRPRPASPAVDGASLRRVCEGVCLNGCHRSDRACRRAGAVGVPADLELGSPGAGAALARLAGPGARLRRRGARGHADRAAGVFPARAHRHGRRLAALASPEGTIATAGSRGRSSSARCRSDWSGSASATTSSIIFASRSSSRAR